MQFPTPNRTCHSRRPAAMPRSSPISVPHRAPRMSRKDLCQEILKHPAATPLPP